MQSYLKYKAYYDRKAKAAPLRTKDIFFILNRKPTRKQQKHPSENSDGLVLIRSKMSYRTITIMSADWAQRQSNYFIVFDYENTLHKLRLRIILSEKVIGKKKIHSLLKMTYMPTLGTLILDKIHFMLNTKLMISKKTRLKMNLLLYLKYTTLPPPKIFETVGGPQQTKLL